MGIGRGDKKSLGQVRPAVAGVAEELYHANGVEAEVKNITIANTTSSAAKYTVYFSADNSTFDQSTALYYEIELAGNSTIADTSIRDVGLGGAFRAQTDTNNALTFTLSGTEEAL